MNHEQVRASGLSRFPGHGRTDIFASKQPLADKVDALEVEFDGTTLKHVKRTAYSGRTVPLKMDEEEKEVAAGLAKELHFAMLEAPK